MPNHYRTLGVDPSADEAVIRSAYLALMRRHHPDKGGSEADRARAQQIIAAYEVLRDRDRRAAYDSGRRADLQPAIGAGGISAGARAASSARRRVRGGHAARNLFLLLAAGTAGLATHALQQPIGTSAERSTVASPQVRERAENEPALRPPLSATEKMAIEEAAMPPPTMPMVEAPLDGLILSPPTMAQPAPMPLRSAEPKIAERRAGGGAARPSKPPPPQTTLAVSNAGAGTDQLRVDIAGLERHLMLLTDQSFRHADEGRKARLSVTRDTFVQRLEDCDDDLCRRDAYLRRNQEVADIMRR